MFMWPTDRAGTIGWPLRHNFSKAVLAGTMLIPEASDGPLTACNVRGTADVCGRACADKMCEAPQPANTCETVCTVNAQDVVSTIKTWPGLHLLHGSRYMCAKTGPHWTSETDVGQQPPEMCHTCSFGPLATIGPSDGQCATTFQKWSSRTACSFRCTIGSMQCLKQLVHARRVAWSRRAMRFNGPTETRRAAWPVHEMWFQQL